MAVAGIAYDWLNDSDSNFGRCVDCNRLSPLQQQRHKSVKRPVSTITFPPCRLGKIILGDLGIENGKLRMENY